MSSSSGGNNDLVEEYDLNKTIRENDDIDDRMNELDKLLETHQLLKFLDGTHIDVPAKGTRSNVPAPVDLMTLLKETYAVTKLFHRMLLDSSPSAAPTECGEDIPVTFADLDDRLTGFKREILTEVRSAVREEVLSSLTPSYSAVIGNEPSKPPSPTPSSCEQRNITRKTKQTERVLREHERERNLCDPFKTVAVKGITDYKTYVASSRKTLTWFNSYFDNVCVTKIKPTKSGTLLIEVKTAEDARKVVEEWKRTCFGSEERPTTASLLANTGSRHKAVMDFVDPELKPESIREAFSNTVGFQPATIARLSTRRNQDSTSVVLSFASQEQKDKAMSVGIKVESISYNIRDYFEKPRVRVNQCRQCYSFGHPAAWCPNKLRCPLCSLEHPAIECPVAEDGNDDRLNCPNCTENRKHSAVSLSCPKLKERLRTAKYD